MTKYKISVHQEEWIDYFIEADSEEEAEEKISSGDYDQQRDKASDYTILSIEEI